jgi:glycosyltransferase involved in cell wall biosynthesis
MISILMPIFNGIEFINESVESIIEQTYTKWELIIGINGHPPNSFAYNIAKEYESLYSIRVIDFPNIKGKANTLNAMLPYCKYDHVAILDVDDIWSDNKLQAQSTFINDYDVVGSQCVYFGDMNNISPQIPIGNISTIDFTKVNPVINSSAIIRKDLCWWNTNYDGIEDYDLWLRLRKQNKTFYNVDSILVKHRIHQSSAFNSKGNGSKVADLLKMHNM